MILYIELFLEETQQAIFREGNSKSCIRRRFKLKKFIPADIVYAVLRALINQRFLMVALLICTIPFIVYGAKKSWGHTENKVEDWVPRKFPETQQLLKFGKIFQANEILLVSWDDCTLDSPKVKEFKDKLLSPQPTSDGEQRVLFNEVITGQDVYELLSQESMGLDNDEILERMKGFLISSDYSKTCLIAMLSDDGKKFRPDAINGLWTIAKSIGLDMTKFHAAGPSLDSVAIDSICRTHLVEMNVASYIIGIIISFLCFRSWRAAITVFLVSFMNQQMCLALIYWLNIQFDSILMLSVNLTFVLSMSAGIHLTNYYRDAITRLEPRDAMFSALKTALVPTFISIITTIAGLLSFLSSQLIPIRKFGIVSSSALAISVTIILIFLPIYYISFPINSWKNVTKKESKWDLANILERMFYPWVSRVPYLVLAVSLMIAVVCFWGAAHIRTSIGLHSMLRSYTQPIKDYTWVEDQFGPMIPVEVMFTWPQGENDQIFDRLCFVRDVTNNLKSDMKDVGIISITNFIPEIPSYGARTAAARRLINRKIETVKEGFTKSGYFKEQDGNQYWRITVRTFAMRRIDYGPIIQQIKDIVEGQIQKAGQNAIPTPAVETVPPVTAATDGVFISDTASGETSMLPQGEIIEQELNKIKANADKFDAAVEDVVPLNDNFKTGAYIPKREQKPAAASETVVETLQQQTVSETSAAEESIPTLPDEDASLTDIPALPDDAVAVPDIPVDDAVNIPVDTDASLAIPVDDAANIPVDTDAMPDIVVDDGVNPDAPAQTNADASAEESETSSKKTAPLPLTMPEFIVTGGVPVVYKAQNQLLDDLKVSFLTAFLIIGLILVCLFRSFRCGTLAVYPSLLPVIFVFGIVGWIGLRVEMGTMLTGSAALGIAVDNTVHFITWYRIGHQRGMDRKEATRLAYRKCGSAMFQTSSVCSLGLVTYMISPFIPTIYFSFFMCALLFSALFSDLTVLPAILLSGWGKIFLRSVKKAEPEATEE